MINRLFFVKIINCCHQKATLSWTILIFTSFWLGFFLRCLKGVSFLFPSFCLTLLFNSVQKLSLPEYPLASIIIIASKFALELPKWVSWLVSIPGGQLILDKWEHSHTFDGKVLWYGLSGGLFYIILQKLKYTYPLRNCLCGNTANQKY